MKTKKPWKTKITLIRDKKGLAMRALAISCMFFLMYAVPIDAKQMKNSSNQKTLQKIIAQKETAREKNALPEKMCILVARPVCASAGNKTDDAWFAALCEAYYQVRLGSLKNVDVVASESLFQYIPLYKDFSREITLSEYNECADRFHAAYVLYPKYELVAGGKEFSYYAEVVRISDNKTLLTFDKKGIVENLGRLLDSLIISMQKDAHVLNPDQFPESFQVSLLGENNKNILKNCKQLGTLLLNDNYVKSENPVKTAKAYKVLVSAAPRMFLADLSGAIAAMRIDDFDASAELFGFFAEGVRDYAPVFPAMCKSYRMCRKFDEAQKCFELAEKAGLSSTQLLLEKSLTFQAMGDVKKAGEIYASMLVGDPDEPNALRFCAWQNNEQNRPADGLRCAERLLSRLPQDGKALLEKGRSLWLLKKYDSANEVLRLAQKQMPDDPLPALYLGDVCRQTGDFNGSSEYYEKAMNMMPADPYAGLKAAEAYTLAGNLQKALVILKKIESKFPENSLLLKKIGLLEYQLADKENARKHLEKYNELGEKDAAVLMSLASLYSDLTEYDKAIDTYTKALTLADDKNSCEMELSKLYLKKGEAANAMRCLSDIIVRRPDFDHVNKYMAEALEMTGDKKQAIAFYEKERKLFGDKGELQKKLGAAYFELNNLPEAEKEYLKLIKTDTAGDVAYFSLAIINLKKGNIEKADEFCSLGARCEGGDADLYYQIGTGYQSAGMQDKALAFSLKSVALSGKRVEAWQQLASILLRMQKDSAAAEACVKVFEFDNDRYKDYLVKAADTYKHCGKMEKARELYDKFLALGFTNRNVSSELSAIEFSNKNYKRVIELQKAFAENAPLESALMLAESYCATGQFDEALPCCERALAKSPDNIRALELSALADEKLGDGKKALLVREKLMGLPGVDAAQRKDNAFHTGQLYEDQNQKDMAIRVYEKNIIDYPDDIRNYERAASLCVADRNWKRAVGYLENAVTLTNATPLLRKTLAQSFAAQGDRINAIAQYKQYLSVASGDSAAWNELGMILVEQEHYAEAKEILKKATTLMPRNFNCFSLLGSCCMKTGAIAEAIVPLEKAHELDRSDVQVMADLSQCYRSIDDKKKHIALLMDWTSVDPGNIKALKDCGELLLGDGKTREAVDMLESACSLDSIDARVHMLLAKGYEKLGKTNAILAHLEKAMAHDSSNADIHYETGRLFNALRQFSRAEPYLQKAIALDPLHAAAHYEYSCLQRAQKKFDQAFENAQVAAQSEPYNTAYLMQQVQTAYLCGKKDLAFSTVRKLYAKEKSSLEILQWAGLLYKECGNADSAKQLLEKAVSLSSSCASCFKNLGDIYRSEANYEKAIGLYGQALAVGTFDEDAALGLGISFLYSGDKNRARQMFEKTVQEAPKSDEALYWLCSVYFRLDNKDKAGETLSRLSNGRKSAWIHCIQGELSEAEGKIDEALISFTVAANLMPENSIAYAGAGRMQLIKKQYEKSIENFGRALARDQHNVQFLLGLGKAYEGLGQNDAALDLYTDIASKSPKESEVYELLGGVLSKQENHRKSVEVFLKGISLYPKNTQLYYSIAREYRLLAQIDDAVNAYKKAIKTSKDDYTDTEAYRDLGDIYFYELKDGKEARKYYQKYVKNGGKDEKVVQLVNSMAN